MDCVGPLQPRARSGDNAILIVVDRFTKYTVLMPCKMEATAADWAALFIAHVYKYFGLPRYITSDRDTRFTAHY